MNSKIIYGVIGTLLAFSVGAVEIEGVQVPETTTVGEHELVLNGAGVRKKLWVEVYVGALYLTAKTSDAAAVIDADGPKRITMDMLYAVSKKKLVNGWNDGFGDNTDAATLETLENQIATFNGFFPDTEVGDRIVIDMVPGSGTTVTINDETRGTITGEAFAKAVLRIWLGEKPPTDDLKAAMLGGDA